MIVEENPGRRTRSYIQDAVQTFFEGLWSAAFRLAGQRCRHRGARDGGPRVVSVPPAAGAGSGERVLVVVPHPDDEVAGCAGTLLAHRARGDRVTIACATDGRRSRAYGLSPDEMAARRRLEAEEAARVLGVELEWIGLPEGEWETEVLTSRLRALLVEIEPDVVYAPSRVDFHAEHERVARALAASLGDLAPSPLVRIYPVQVPLTPILSNLLVSVDRGREVAAALSCHVTQIGSLRRCLRLRRYSASLHGAEAPVEELWQLDAGQYRRLHLEPPARPLVDVFRGLRYYAWSDPLAYMVGRRERRRLAGLLGTDAAPRE